MNKYNTFIILILLAALLFLVSCQSNPITIPAEVQPFLGDGF